MSEAAKAYAKQLLDRDGVVVIKPDGLTEGKGVVIAKTEQQANEAIDRIMETPEANPAKPQTNFVGPISFDENGHMMVRYLNPHGERLNFDLTAAIEEIAGRMVLEHMQKFHGHQI